MTSQEEILLLFTELENYQPPELNIQLTNFNSYLTTKEIKEEMVSMGIFNQLPNYLQLAPKETLAVFKSILIHREVAMEFISTTFVSDFHLYLLCLLIIIIQMKQKKMLFLHYELFLQFVNIV